MIGGKLSEKKQDRVAVITVKKSALRRRRRHQRRPLRTVPVEQIEATKDNCIQNEQEKLLADVMNDLIGEREAPLVDEEASVDEAYSPSMVPDLSALLEDDPVRDGLACLLEPEARDRVRGPMSDFLAEMLLGLLPKRTPHRKRKAAPSEAVIADSIRLNEEDDDVEVIYIKRRPLRHMRVKTRRFGKRKKKLRPIDILPKLGILIAVCIFAWPVVSDAYKQWAYSRTISEGYSYDWEDPKYQEIVEQAHLYNKMLSGTLPAGVDVNSIWPYEKQLDYGSGGMMCWIEIPDLSLKLPVYHGSDEESLMAGVGHMERTSLPVGGDHTKCALSGHTGMHNERMFDSLDDLEENDTVILHSMGMDLYYSVTYKEVVEPDALDKLYIDCEDSQLVLITCTPRGINSHRLLVHAVEVDAESTQVANSNPVDAVMNYLLSPTVIFLTGMLLVLLVLFLLWFFRWRDKKVLVRVEELEVPTAPNEAFSAFMGTESSEALHEPNYDFDDFEWETEDGNGDGDDTEQE